MNANDGICDVDDGTQGCARCAPRSRRRTRRSATGADRRRGERRRARGATQPRRRRGNRDHLEHPDQRPLRPSRPSRRSSRRARAAAIGCSTSRRGERGDRQPRDQRRRGERGQRLLRREHPERGNLTIRNSASRTARLLRRRRGEQRRLADDRSSTVTGNRRRLDRRGRRRRRDPQLRRAAARRPSHPTPTISGNNARLGGGINSYSDAENAVTITDSTIAFNNSGDRGCGGGLALGDRDRDGQEHDPRQEHVDRRGAGGLLGRSGPTINSAGYNLEGATSCGFTSGTDKQSTDPLLGGLAFNGGPTPTHAIGPESPAFEAGDPACLPADQRGVPEAPGSRLRHRGIRGARPDAARDDDRLRPGRPDHRPHAHVRPVRRRSRLALRVQHRRRRVRALHIALHDAAAGRRQPHADRPRDRSRRERDPTPSVIEFVILPAAVDELPKPVQGVVVNVAEVSGSVLVGLPTEATGARGSRTPARRGSRSSRSARRSRSRSAPSSIRARAPSTCRAPRTARASARRAGSGAASSRCASRASGARAG